MAVAEIIAEIDDVLRKQTLEANRGKVQLEKLALRLWAETFPSVSLSEYHTLPQQRIEAAWKPVREMISHYETKEAIYIVAEWPATGTDLSRIRVK